jgi:hypothetical protein
MPRRNTAPHPSSRRSPARPHTTAHVLPDGRTVRTRDPITRAMLTAQGSPPADPRTADRQARRLQRTARPPARPDR